MPLALTCLFSGTAIGESLSNNSTAYDYNQVCLNQTTCSKLDPNRRELWFESIAISRSVLFFFTAIIITKSTTSFDIDRYDIPASAMDNIIYALTREREKDITSTMSYVLNNSEISEIISSAGHLLLGLYFFSKKSSFGPSSTSLYTLNDISSIWCIRAGLIRFAHLPSNIITEQTPGLIAKNNPYFLASIFIFPCSTFHLLHHQPMLKAIAYQACSVGFSLYGKGRLHDIKQHKPNSQEATMECSREFLAIGAMLLYTRRMGPSPALFTIIGGQLIKQGAGFSLDAFVQQFLSETPQAKYLFEYILEVAILFLAGMESLHSHDVVQSTYISKLRDAGIYYTGIRLTGQASWLINDIVIKCASFYD